MEFDFRKNTLLGQYSANLSMEHQLFARMLEEELGTDHVMIVQVMDMIERANRQPLTEQKWLGTMLTLTMFDGEVSVKANTLYQERDEALEDGLSLYDSESYSVCGLLDFEHLLEQWKLFITK